MAKTEGFNQYICDRCSAEIYATETDPKIQSWKNIERFNAEGSSVKRLLCSRCNQEYKELVRKQDNDFQVFMEKGGRG